MNEAFMKVCGMDLARNLCSCTGLYTLNSNVFNNVTFLPSQMTEIPKPADIETAHSEDGVTDIYSLPASSGQQWQKS